MSRHLVSALSAGLAILLVPVLTFAQAAPSAAAQTAAATAAPTTPAPERARVDGFRSAQWGMTEAQVKQVIQKDFNIGGDKIKAEDNLAERTKVLTVMVPDLLEGAGTARVSYIFGFNTKKLIQVNVVWSTGIDPQATPEKIVAAANQLRLLFADSGYDPETVASNVRLNDGSVLVFEGADAEKHTTLLRLATAAAPAQAGKPEKAEAALSLSYVMDPRSPDIYRLKKGQF